MRLVGGVFYVALWLCFSGRTVIDKVVGILWHNLIPVTLGNMLVGGLFIRLVYWFIYLRNDKGEQHERSRL